MDNRNDDLFDDLFEPFELDDGPPPQGETIPTEPEPEPTQETAPALAMLTCPSCATSNSNANHYCEACGARLSPDPLPIAPLPLSRSGAGMRALVVLVVILLIVAIGALIINLRDDDPATSSPASTSSAPTTSEAPVFVELTPATVEASSELGQSFGADNLLDKDFATEWQDASQRGNSAKITFTFAEPVRIASIEIVNLQDNERFRRNYRVRSFVITVDDLSIPIPGELADENEPQRIQIGTVGTTRLAIEVRTTYPAESVGDLVPFLELAIAEIRFFGTTEPP